MCRSMFIFLNLLTSILFPLEALHRDYCNEWGEIDEDGHCGPFCLDCAHYRYWPSEEIDIFLVWKKNIIPATGPACYECKRYWRVIIPTIFTGYIEEDFKYLQHFKRHLFYYINNKNCNCYWPEYSQQAAEINDKAYVLFAELISTTSLSKIKESWDQPFVGYHNICCGDRYKYDGDWDYWTMNKHRLTVSFVAQQFHFSDYFRVCRDIEHYARSEYDNQEFAMIKDKLEDILEALYPNFISLYTSCYESHPNQDIAKEISFMKLLVNDESGLDDTDVFPKSIFYLQEDFYEDPSLQDSPLELECESSTFESENVLKNLIPKAIGHVLSPQSDIFLEQGTLLNNLLLHNKAIEVLTQAIQLNPSNRDTYIERALAYFETNQLSLALQDYEAAKKLTTTPSSKLDGHKAKAIYYIPKNSLEFSKGLIYGTLEGGGDAALEFIPSLWSGLRGMVCGLWAFVCSPIDVTGEMIDTAYAIGEFLSDHSANECLQCVVPELKELSLSWKEIDEYSKGKKVGFIIVGMELMFLYL